MIIVDSFIDSLIDGIFEFFFAFFRVFSVHGFFYSSVEFCRILCSFTGFLAFVFFYSVLARSRNTVIFL